MFRIDPGRFARGLALALGLGALSILPGAADDPPPPSGEATGGSAPDTEGVPASEAVPEPGPDAQSEDEAIHPDAVSPFLKRAYTTKPKRLFKVLIEELTAAGFPPEETDAEQRTVKTAFVDFDQDKHDHPVAEMPPRFGGGYHILQMLKVKTGKVSIEAIVAPVEGGSQLNLRARLLVQGLDRKRGIRVLTDRRSSGVIEAEFLARLEEQQRLKRIPE
jgi:hypothetical protein